ncbi:hypothetical protein ccbrp13_38450 [Ktedonobacteria bacterium brp13]|nr:hypothetical protein ccbrp13_38450 [Ktedonobacteria bacterium brp13]
MLTRTEQAVDFAEYSSWILPALIIPECVRKARARYFLFFFLVSSLLKTVLAPRGKFYVVFFNLEREQSYVTRKKLFKLSECR